MALGPLYVYVLLDKDSDNVIDTSISEFKGVFIHYDELMFLLLRSGCSSVVSQIGAFIEDV